MLFRAFFFFIFALNLCASGFSFASEDNSSRLLDIKEVISDKGIKAWLVEDHSNPLIYMSFAFTEAGSASESLEKQGLARMVSNTLDEGAGYLDSQAFQEALRESSIKLGFSSSRDNFAGSLATLSENKMKAFNLLQLALTEPRFDKDPVERMRQANIARIKNSLSDPDWLVSRLMLDTVFENHPYGLNSGGTISSLNNITEQDLRDFTKRYFTRDRLVISVAGDITEDELRSVLDGVFGSLPEKSPDDEEIKDIPDIKVQNTGKITMHRSDLPQSFIRIVQEGIDDASPDYYPALVMNNILGSGGFGSRLMEIVREQEGLTYGIYSNLQHYNHADLLLVSVSTENANVNRILEIIQDEWKKLKDQGVSETELTDAKNFITGSMPLSLSSLSGIVSVMNSLQVKGYNKDYLDNYVTNVNSVNKQDVDQVAKTYLDEDKFAIIMVGNPEGIFELEKIDSLPGVK